MWRWLAFLSMFIPHHHHNSICFLLFNVLIGSYRNCSGLATTRNEPGQTENMKSNNPTILEFELKRSRLQDTRKEKLLGEQFVQDSLANETGSIPPVTNYKITSTKRVPVAADTAVIVLILLIVIFGTLFLFGLIAMCWVLKVARANTSPAKSKKSVLLSAMDSESERASTIQGIKFSQEQEMKKFQELSGSNTIKVRRKSQIKKGWNEAMSALSGKDRSNSPGPSICSSKTMSMSTQSTSSLSSDKTLISSPKGSSTSPCPLTVENVDKEKPAAAKDNKKNIPIKSAVMKVEKNKNIS